eukprot:TRINITY_DN3661_c2_g1_i1.p2 TRINITY_DN3661_c2_g1~~TRINITY_DN3661_c2_g1_i1.p2  ORF type:complete len:192 (+),score=13.69 TRINITY_DN3661_c2_g1_i1:477-1052(+)
MLPHLQYACKFALRDDTALEVCLVAPWSAASSRAELGVWRHSRHNGKLFLHEWPMSKARELGHLGFQRARQSPKKAISVARLCALHLAKNVRQVLVRLPLAAALPLLVNRTMCSRPRHRIYPRTVRKLASVEPQDVSIDLRAVGPHRVGGRLALALSLANKAETAPEIVARNFAENLTVAASQPLIAVTTP